MTTSEINWRGGVVTYWGLDELDLQKDILTQIDLFKEDLAQVCYGNDIILDLGYYPEFEPHGRFVLKVAKSEDWENPILRLESRTTAKLVQDLYEGVRVACAAAKGKA
jgi:hypothetical protein